MHRVIFFGVLPVVPVVLPSFCRLVERALCAFDEISVGIRSWVTECLLWNDVRIEQSCSLIRFPLPFSKRPSKVSARDHETETTVTTDHLHTMADALHHLRHNNKTVMTVMKP